MAYELVGKVKLLQEPKSFASGFTIREFVVTVEEGRYPQDIILQCVQDKVGLLDSVSEGQDVKVTFDIRGREYNGRYFNNLQAWKIEAEGGDNSAKDDDRPPIPDEFEAPADFDDDIPF